MGIIQKFRKKFLHGFRSSQESYVNDLVSKGAKIGKNLLIVMPETVNIDRSMPYLLTIGDNVSIASNVAIMTHDACWRELTHLDGRVYGHTGPVTIGNNVFLGYGCVVMCNVSICDNVIVGVNSIVSRSITEPGIYVGSPAVKVSDFDHLRANRLKHQKDEARTLVLRYQERFGRIPPKEELSEYFFLFEERKIDTLPPQYIAQMSTTGDFGMVKENFLSSEPEFNGYDEFIKWCTSVEQ